MEAEKKVCQNCKVQFTIEPDDFMFYEKLKVPPPTWCSRCSLQKRLCFRNERMLYKRKCDAPGHDEEMLSNYSPDKLVKVYDLPFWLGDGWDAMDYGRDYDFLRPFMTQMKELIRDVPWESLYNTNAVNSDYCNLTTDNKNCYLVFGGDFNENCSYSTFCMHSKDSMDLYLSSKCELCYEIVDSESCFRTMFSRYAVNCSSSAFLYNCANCQDCFGCVNLRNKSHCILNEQYSKEEYEKKIQELNLGSREGLRLAREQFLALKAKLPHRYAEIIRSVGSTGDNIFSAKNCKDGFDIMGPVEDLHHVLLAGWNLKDSRNCDHSGHNSELIYDSFAVFSGSQRVAFSYLCESCQNIQYCYNCQHSSNLFGCVGLKNKQYCIFNKQYSKEEYEALVPRIIEHMGEKYGASMPADLSPFCYNETSASEYFPLTKEEALAKGYTWKDPDVKKYTPTKQWNELPDTIADVADDITKEIISCEHWASPAGERNESCTTAFRIADFELQFYRRMNLPIPTLCPSCRHYQRLKQRNPITLYSRGCECGGANTLISHNTRTGRGHAPIYLKRPMPSTGRKLYTASSATKVK